MELWTETPGEHEVPVELLYYPAKEKKTNATVICFPGGGYSGLAAHEGKSGYAQLLNSFGMDAFVLLYRVAPHRHPLPLLDARRSVRYVRAHAKEYGIDPDRIGVMGSSAGGHLVASLCTCQIPLDLEGIDETDTYSYLPNAQILCYPVIDLAGFGHVGSGQNLLGEKYGDPKLMELLACQKHVHEKTPTAFLWHTADDPVVNIENSLAYVKALREKGIDTELHVFPNGPHGLGIAPNDPYVSRWTQMLEAWLSYIGFLK